MTKFIEKNLIHDNRLLTVPKTSFQMIPKNKNPYQDHPVKNDSDSGSNFLSLNRDQGSLQKYWANPFISKVLHKFLDALKDIIQLR